MSNVVYWVWLSLACGAGSRVPDKLLPAFDDDPVNVYNASEEDYLKVENYKRDLLKALCDKSLDKAELYIKWCKDNNVGILTPNDELYPRRLWDIHSKPMVLYYIGKIPEIDDNLCIAAVGTRSMTKYGSNMAYTFSYDMARCGAIVVSGLAAGIDSVCHRAVLDAGGHTIAVLGCGIDRVYPPQNRELMCEIARKGTLFTEYHPFTPPASANFPIRNRIISGLSQGTVIFEADIRSGSLITARTALRQGRDVFALPGKIGEINSLGTNELIKNGAKMVINAYDILCEYEYLYPHRIHTDNLGQYRSLIKTKPLDKFGFKVKAPIAITKVNNKTVEKVSDSENSEPQKANNNDKNIPSPDTQLNDTEKAIYKILSKAKGTTYDEIMRLDYSVSEIMMALTSLEIKGLIEAMPGGMYSKT